MNNKQFYRMTYEGLCEVKFILNPTATEVRTSSFNIVKLEEYYLIVNESEKDMYPNCVSHLVEYSQMNYIPCSIEGILGTSTTSSSSSKESMPFSLNPFESSSGNPKSSSSSGGKSGKPSSSSDDYPKSSSSSKSGKPSRNRGPYFSSPYHRVSRTKPPRTSSSSTSNTTKFANDSTISSHLSKLCINPKSGTSSSSTSKTVHHEPNFDSLFSTSNTSNRGNSNQEYKLLTDDIINELITKRIPQPVLKLIMDNNGELNNELMNRIITLLDESKLECLLSTVNPSRALTSSSTSLSNIGAERLKSHELNQLDDNQVSKLYGNISDEAMNIILEKQGILGDDLFNQIFPLVNKK
tara:strand:+ start:214 stop:1272 length:1059 start_codon:yes stop_codon:yes gene_type:complete